MPYLARAYQLTKSLLYHIYNRGNAKKEIFHSEEDYLYFINILISYSKNRDIKVYHWVVMPNHYHLLAELENPKDLSSIMAGVGRSYVHYYHRKYQSAGHLFQDRFKSQPVEKESYLLACGRYIERNPIDAQLSILAEEYPYSSATFYVRAKQDGLTIESPSFASMGDSPLQRKERYTDFLRNYNREEEEAFEKVESPCGSQEFLRRLIRERNIFVPRNGRPRG